MKTLKDQEKSEQDSDKAEAKADKERVYLKKEIDGVKKMLQKARDDLSEAEKLHARYIKNIEDTKSEFLFCSKITARIIYSTQLYCKLIPWFQKQDASNTFSYTKFMNKC